MRDFLRKNLWALVILGMIIVTLVIILIFLLINKCISRKEKYRILNLQRKADMIFKSNKYEERNVDSRMLTPPLPPRTQFLTEAELPDYEEIPEQIPDQQPGYLKLENETHSFTPPPLHNNPNPSIKSGVSFHQTFKKQAEILPPPPPPLHDDPDPTMTTGPQAQSYENLAEGHDYEESTVQQPDYVKVEDGPEILPPPPPPLYSDPSSNMKTGSLAQSYENLAEGHDYEESTVQQPDYVKMEDGPEILPPPPPPPLDDDPNPNMKTGDPLAQSYENLAEEHDYEEPSTDQPDYVKMEDGTEIFPPPPPPLYNDPNANMKTGSLAQSYENLAEEHDYEEPSTDQSDYVKVEDEEVFLPHSADRAGDGSSTEDYDDIGGEDDDEEDYDDVA